MKTSNQSVLVRVAAIAATFALSGCLSDGSSSDTNSAEPPPPSGNTPPTISGNPPAAVQVGEAYSFTPQASDADGDALTFSIENMPSWGSFDTRTGRLSGTPTLADIGPHNNVRITVSDNEASATMPGFAIDVTQVGTFSTTLSWTPPSLNEDGSTATDLAGYKIYYGQSSRSYSNEIRIDNPSVTTYVVENLSAGTYYFAATAFNSANEESRYSAETVRTLN